ncbi:MAG: hypothetical protein QY323_04450 [Patescibacteria group bacterium]|nr:MAG: hypothetical protein QY323_04450 [Patescibacteria group bacterium]
MIRPVICIALAFICLSQREVRAEPSVVYGEGAFGGRKRMSQNVFFFGEARSLEGRGTEQYEETVAGAVLGFGGDFGDWLRVEAGFGLVTRYVQEWRSEPVGPVLVTQLKRERMNGWSEAFRVFMTHRRMAASGEVLIGMPFSANEERKPFIEGRYSLAVLTAGKKDEGGRFWIGTHLDQLNDSLASGINLAFVFGKQDVVSFRLFLSAGVTDDAPDWSSRLSIVCDFE